MNSPERSPKRQRTSFSPASPPYHLSKQEPLQPKLVYHPQTPQSPLRMSTGHETTKTTSRENPNTPPLSAGLTSNMPDSSADQKESIQASTSQSQDVAMTTDTSGSGIPGTQITEQDDTIMSEAADHRRTDHEREKTNNGYEPGVVPLLCQTPHPSSVLHPATNLLSLYSLDNIASSVARKDPITGEKINKLRKSYEGKVKNLNLLGRNKPTTIPGELLGLMEWPEEGWYDQRIYGKELDKALEPSAPVMSKLDRAMSMNPGRLPTDEHERWKGVLGLDDGPPAQAVKTPLSGAVRNPAQAALNRAQPTAMRSSAPASPRGFTGLSRPDRQGKKRRYDDASFEGYGEGGVGVDDDGYSTGGLDDRRSSAGRKRRRDFEQHNSGGSNSNSGGGSSNSAAFGGLGSQGMVGVRSS